MLYAKMSRVLLAAAVVVLLPAAARAQVCASCVGSQPATYQPTTTYLPYQQTSLMPVTSAAVGMNGCNTCYRPETKMRWTYSRIERTSYKPITLIDPCTGCQQTAYQPVTKKSLLPWLHRVPETTYKPVACGVTCPTACDPCGSACNSCGGTSYGYTSSGTCSSCVGGSMTTDPAYGSGSVGQTFAPDSRTSQKPSEDLEPSKTIESETPSTPELSSPNGRGVSLPKPPAPVHQTVSWLTVPSEPRLIPLRPAAPAQTQPVAPAAPAETVEFSGWVSVDE